MRVKKWAGIVAMAGLTVGLSVAVAAKCVSVTVEVPEPAELNLQDGDHVIASANTERGKFEARVQVRGKVASAPRFYIGGRLLNNTPEAQVPSDLRSCLKEAHRASLPPTGWLDRMTRSVQEWLVPTVHAKAKIKCVVTASCNQNTCCALATCGGHQAVSCVGY